MKKFLFAMILCSLSLVAKSQAVVQSTDSCSTVATKEEPGAVSKTLCYYQRQLVDVKYTDAKNKTVREIQYNGATGKILHETRVMANGNKQVTDYYDNGKVKEIQLLNVKGQLLHLKRCDEKGAVIENKDYNPVELEKKKKK